MDFGSSRAAGGLVDPEAPEAPEELERWRNRSVGRRRRPGGPGTCRGMMLVMSRQVSGTLGMPISILAKISKIDLFFVHMFLVYIVGSEIHYTGPTGEVAGPPQKGLERPNPPQIAKDSIEQLLSSLKKIIPT